MNIGFLTAANPQLRPKVETEASPDAQTSAQAVASDAVVVGEPKLRPTVNVAPSTRYPSMRAALDAQVAADMSSGTLSHEDGAKVVRTLDAIDNRATAPGVAAYTPQAVRAYLSTIPRGTLVDRAA